MLKKIVLIGAVAAMSISLTACGSHSKTETNVKSTTTGQELTDLQTAFDSGIISEDEYEKKKKEILKE